MKIRASSRIQKQPEKEKRGETRVAPAWAVADESLSHTHAHAPRTHTDYKTGIRAKK